MLLLIFLSSSLQLLGLPSSPKLFHSHCLFPAINFWFFFQREKNAGFSRLLGNFRANSEKWGLFQTTLYITVKSLKLTQVMLLQLRTCAHVIQFMSCAPTLPVPIPHFNNCISFSVKQVSQRKEHRQKSHTLKRRYLTW